MMIFIEATVNLHSVKCEIAFFDSIIFVGNYGIINK